MSLGFSQKLVAVCQINDVADRRPCACDEKAFVLDEGHVSDHPAFALSLFEFTPLIRSEESILIGDVEKLAQQTNQLGFGPEREVSNNQH